MNDDQITSLAREYAEENVKQPEDMSNSLHNEYLKLFADEAEELIRFLLRRFCIVEKGAVKEQYKDAQKDQHNPKGDFALSLAGRNRSAVLIELFPEIAKEVE